MCGFCAFRSQLWLPVRFRNFRNDILCSAHAAWDRQGRPSSSSHQPINEWRRPARDSHLITPISGRKKNKKKARTLFTRSGSKWDRRWAASICSETATFCVGACVCWRRADAPRQKRSSERLCASASSCLQCCCSLPLLWNKRTHSCLFFILFVSCTCFDPPSEAEAGTTLTHLRG